MSKGQFYRIIESKGKDKKWHKVDKGEYGEVPFNYGRIKADRKLAKNDGDKYRVYSKKSKDGLTYSIDKVITYNEKEPDRRIVYRRVDRRKK